MVLTRSQSAAKIVELGSVEHFPLNLDVLLLIAEYAHPRDLLNLARTCRHCRELLIMDQSSALVWKAARSHIKGMPDCPADLTEPEYADLAFDARCHGCGHYAHTIFWEMRRRYCPDCKPARLCRLSSCHKIIQKKYVLGMGHFMNGKEIPLWVDREQMESFMDEYKHSSHKKQLLSDRQEKLVAICRHSRRCENWYRVEQQALLQKRDTSIFERLKQFGYEPDVKFFGHHAIRESRKCLFNTSKPLTDKEWDRIWPEWLETMNSFRLQRLERTVYLLRRRLLKDEYETYMECPDTPPFDLLPHVADVACFPPFRDIIRAPEETPMNDELFGSAFAQFPELVDEWRKKLDAEVAELVQIPSHLSLKDISGGRVIASSSTASPESSRTPTDKLRLACALFQGGSIGIFTYPDVFSTSMHSCRYPSYDKVDSERTASFWDRYGVKYVEEAPYVVHACGLDPNVASVEDMDRRNARLKCLSCASSSVYSWREATWHAFSRHKASQPTCWQLIDDDSEEMNEIRAAELADNEVWPRSSRCLLCSPRVGDELQQRMIISHLMDCHNIEFSDIEQGVHYQPVSMKEHRSVCKVQRPGQKEPKFEMIWRWDLHDSNNDT